MDQVIMILREPGESQDLPFTRELLTCAAQISANNNARITVVSPGDNQEAQPLSGADLLVINNPDLAEYTSEGWEKAVLLAAGYIKPDLVIIPHTSSGYDYAPRIAALLDGGCITSVSGVEITGTGIKYRRSGFHGKLEMLYQNGSSPLVITVLPGAFPAAEMQKIAGEIRCLDADFHLVRTSQVEYIHAEQSNTQLESAEVIIAAGKGIGKVENLELIRQMAASFSRSAIAGSRAACDNGWLPYNAQVGMTGKTVSPLLYVACGISGSMQHISGMKDSKTVVSINRDPEAAIFRHSDICIVEDLEKFIPEFLRMRHE